MINGAADRNNHDGSQLRVDPAGDNPTLNYSDLFNILCPVPDEAISFLGVDWVPELLRTIS